MNSRMSFHRAVCTALILVATVALANPAWAQPAAKMWEEGLVIPTYKMGEPEHNPIFYTGRSYQGAKGPVYPYPLLDKLTDEKVDHTYKAIYLENPYVKYAVLPELGGRIFSGQDKSNGYDFIYRQHVIKPALIGMVGAWISGGVEWNIPHHHRASTFMTVDHVTVENPDGSKTVWMGEIELRHRMKWLVGVTLYPDKSYLKLTVKLFNRTPLPQSLLYFANIAVHANKDYQVIFPPGTEFGTQHGKSEFVNWPVGRGFYGGLDRRGVDVSWWKNLPTPVSIFAWNYEDDFFGGYDHGKQAGIAVIADHHIAPGKKFFEWGNGSEGAMWDKILTDADGPYLELMAGGYSDNQPDYSWIQPGEVKVVEQYFYPIRQLGGIKNANLNAAVNLEVKDGKARVAFNTTSEQRDAVAKLTRGMDVLFEQKVNIGPATPFVKEIALPAGAKPEELQASLAMAGGQELVAYQPAKPKNSPMPAKVVPPADPKDFKSTDELYQAGLRLEQFHNPSREPYPYYEEILNRDPGDYRANVALGILYCKRGMFDTAEKHLRAAIARATHNYTSPKDGEAFYYLGLVLRYKGQYDAADEMFQKAAWSQAWASSACFALAQDAIRKGEYSAAMAFLGRSEQARSLSLRMAVVRIMASADAAVMFSNVVASQLDPLDHWARNERYLALKASGKTAEAEKALDELTKIMRGEPQAYLELAVDYGNCGMWGEAMQVLDRAVQAAPDAKRVHPMIYYYMGYYSQQKKNMQRSRYYYAMAAQMSPEYCFPFRLESIAVLRQAMEVNPNDARAPYYLGNLLYDLQPQEAVKAWELAQTLDANFATVHRNLAVAYAHQEKNQAKAVASLEKAIACDSNDPKLYYELDVLYDAVGADPAKRLALMEKNQQTVAKRDDTLRREVALLILMGKYDPAVELLSKYHFRLWEGESGTHDLYVDAHLLRGQQHLNAGRISDARKDYEAALEYPENLETGRAYRGGGRLPQINYCLGTVYEAQGDREKAKGFYEQAVQGGMEGSDVRYYQGLAQRKLGREDRATEIFDGLIRTGNQRLQAASGLDFFAKFGTRESAAVQQARAHYLIGLGQLGKGKQAEAKQEFEAAIKLNVSHLGARTMLAEVSR